MEIKETPMIPIEQKAWCDCGGEMVARDGYSNTFHSYWRHVCVSCGASQDVKDAKYPRIVHKQVSDHAETTGGE